MARKAEGTKSFPVNINEVAEMLRQIGGAGLDLSVKSENPEGNGVWFRIHHGMSMRSYGEKITVTLTPEGNGTSVHILSECGMPTQLVDGGKNKENVDHIFDFIGYHAGRIAAQAPAQPAPAQTPAAPAAPAAAQPAPVPADAAARDFIFCTSCGKKHPVTASFCNGCGAKLKK